jgi:hypothetical protein
VQLSTRRALVWSAIGASVLIVGRRAIQPRIQRVQATADERARRLPGDELIGQPVGSMTNGITITAAPKAVWPWIAQMGAGRAGWYSYDRLDNGGQPSRTEIVPEFQRLTRGMIFPALPGATDGFTVASFEPEQYLVLGWTAPDGSWLVTWPLFSRHCAIDRRDLSCGSAEAPAIGSTGCRGGSPSRSSLGCISSWSGSSCLVSQTVPKHTP